MGMVLACDICNAVGDIERYHFFTGYQYGGHEVESTFDIVDMCSACRTDLLRKILLDNKKSEVFNGKLLTYIKDRKRLFVL